VQGWCVQTDVGEGGSDAKHQNKGSKNISHGNVPTGKQNHARSQQLNNEDTFRQSNTKLRASFWLQCKSCPMPVGTYLSFQSLDMLQAQHTTKKLLAIV